MKATRSGLWLGTLCACMMAVAARAETFYLPSFTNFSFSAGDFSQWTVAGAGTKLVISDPQAEDGKAADVTELSIGVQLRTPSFTPITGVVAVARFFNPQGLSSCGFHVWTNGVQAATAIEDVNDSSYVTKTYDLTPYAGHNIEIGFAGGRMQIDYLKILWVNNLKIYSAVELEYGTVTGRTYQLQYTDALTHTSVWNNLGAPVISVTNAPHSWFDSSRWTDHRFYRVSETP